VNSRAAAMTLLVLCIPRASADAVSEWSEALIATLPPPARLVSLRPGGDARALLDRYAIMDGRVFRSSEGPVIELERADADWQALQSTLCSDPQVAACEASACQGIQFDAEVQPGVGRDPGAIEARIAHAPPEDLPPTQEGEAGSCRGAPLLPPLDASAGVAGEADAVVDLQPLVEANRATSRRVSAERSTDASQSQTDSMTQGADAHSAGRGFAVTVDTAFDVRGGVSLAATNLPDDTSNWRLLIGADCGQIAMPLDSVVPAREPGRINALVTAGSAAAIAAVHGLTVLREIRLSVTQETLAVFATTDDVAQKIAALSVDTRVAAAQPEFVYRTAAEPNGYDDPFAPFAYGAEQTNARLLHAKSRGAGALIAVIDTGVDVEHPDLRGRIARQVDTTDQGWSADLHGTAIAGIIAANANNGEGSYGIAPEASLIVLKACAPKEAGGLAAKCWTSSLVAALDVALGTDASIINMSLTGPPDPLVARHVELALKRGRLVVAAAGNGGEHGKPAFPAAIPGVLAVTAIDVAAHRYRNANRGDYIDVAAPGVDIVAPAPGGTYPPLSGTSMATAHVSGIAALLHGVAASTSATDVTSALLKTVHDLGPSGRDDAFGSGLVDACEAANVLANDTQICATGDTNAAGK